MGTRRASVVRDSRDVTRDRPRIPDITIDLGASVIAADDDIAVDNRHGIVMLDNLGVLPDASDVIALGLAVDGDRLIVFDTTTARSGGVVARPGDVVRYDAPGFPVGIDGSAGRSYRLTSDLLIPDSLGARQAPESPRRGPSRQKIKDRWC